MRTILVTPQIPQYRRSGDALRRRLSQVRILKVAMVEGVTPKGDTDSGSGLLVGPRLVLTNQHVITDMEAEKVHVGETPYEIANTLSHDEIDVGLVETTKDVDWHPSGISFREPRIVEPILCLGHPPVPKAVVPPSIVAQSGEVVAFVSKADDRQRYVLFSATARPGNSGTPVFAKDGRIIGLVSRNMEEQDRKDGSHRLPFFAAVPSGEVKRALEEMGFSSLLPWETYGR